MSGDYFYADLPVLEDFIAITDSQNFTAVPNDWLIVITDIIGSTRAIEQGRYKDVNLIGACSIVVLLNVAKELEIPFVFGGDGASVLIPPVLLTQAKQALLGLQNLAKQEFSFDLRIGIVPVSAVTSAGYSVEIAKLRVSENYSQGIFIGGGLAYATDLVKQPHTAALYRVGSKGTFARADFSGLECRWHDIPSRFGETVSLLILVTADKAEAAKLYRDVIEHIQTIYGEDDRLHPITCDRLRLSFNRKDLLSEAKVRPTPGWWSRFVYLTKMWLENLLGWLLMSGSVKSGGMDWSQYKDIVIAATDYRKFDDMLRMVIASTTAQRERLTDYLEQRRREGKLVYGLQVSDRALMTCLVFERNGRQVHFIDGADGGYALAAKG